jgi:hypothetical protein
VGSTTISIFCSLPPVPIHIHGPIASSMRGPCLVESRAVYHQFDSTPPRQRNDPAAQNGRWCGRQVRLARAALPTAIPQMLGCMHERMHALPAGEWRWPVDKMRATMFVLCWPVKKLSRLVRNTCMHAAVFAFQFSSPCFWDYIDMSICHSPTRASTHDDIQ